ncbi:MAG: hypothetical protein R3Y56_07810 [Akkermansia sp.]
MNKKYCFHYNMPWRLLLVELLLVLAIALTFDYSQHVVEVSAIEYAQVGVLLAASGLCVWAYFKAQIPLAARQWFLVGASLMFIAAGRELSFGRVFYMEPGQGFDGELFNIYRQYLPCRLYHGFCNVLGALTVVYILWRKLLPSIPSLWRSMKIYVWEIVVIIALLPMNELCEKVLESPNTEEFVEIVLYLLVFNLCWRYARNVGNVWRLPNA